MEQINMNNLIIKENNSDNTDIKNAENDSGSLSLINGSSDDNNIRYPNVFEHKTIKRKREESAEELEEKRLAQEKYDQELHEQRYKRLMHLLNQSEFYATCLLDNISFDSLEVMMNNKNKEKELTATNENIPPHKTKKIKNDKQEYNRKQLVTIKSKIKNKLNLSEEEIADELLNSDSQIQEEIVDIPKYFNGSLYPYQKHGLQWLKVLYENGLNGILADEMGLGKTVQVIALLCHLIEKQQSGPYLIIVPLSTLPNWISEFAKFAPSLPVVVFHGKQSERKSLYSKIIKSYHIMDGFKTPPIVLSTFEMPVKESNFISNQNWRYIIIDEGHRIKNHKCLLVKILRTFKSMNRLLLTGTPLQNNLAELWSLLNFLLPDIFNDLTVFESWFNANELQRMDGKDKILKQEEEKQILLAVRKILKPFVLRREKAEVNINIPSKKEVVVYAPLTCLQRELYTAILNKKQPEEKLILDEPNGIRPKRKCVLKNVQNNSNVSTPFVSERKDKLTDKTITDLDSWKEVINVTDENRHFLLNLHFKNKWFAYKKIVNHPYLLLKPVDLALLPKDNNHLLKYSGKLMVLDVMLAKLKSQGHKVLLFSTMTTMLDLIEDYLASRDYIYVRLDGSDKLQDRDVNIKEFNEDPKVFLFLLSTKAGGIGLNLAAADTVIIYDSDWNPQVDIQAMARCHRIGQTRPVVIYKFCAKGTIDEAIVTRAHAKRLLEKMVISKDLSYSLNAPTKKLLKVLKELLESTEFSSVTSSDDVFTEAELNELLDRSDLNN
ncbi:PREDICTED: lymphocyte-specific helicase-like isoform X2 [Polistes dominula]|uniref:Lymphocyte-specific helicase-like isoform X2 n=1 Tax=Polistes dominula TaxID=743375 RepID=A0ABM1JG48_POLDO|nr:PREDICTED: lymphocyte-specific helicase-like isoform X2 [Polistes dominula]